MAASNMRACHISPATDTSTLTPISGRRGRSDPERRAKTRQLFSELDRTTDESRRQALRQQLVEQNMGVAVSIARRYYGRGEQHADLDQVAYVGLVKAVAGFNPARSADFLSYAVPTIAGEIKRHFRDRCWAVRPPRRIQEMQGKISRVRERLVHELGREPGSGDIAAELGVAEDEVIEALGADGCFSPSSLDAPAGREGPARLDGLGEDDRGFAECEGRLLLTCLLESLPPRDRQILHDRYGKGWTQERIAQRIGVSQMQVSRLLSRILRDLGGRAAT